MTRMIPSGANGRTIAIIAVACILLIALVLATSGGLSTSSPSPAPTTAPATVAAPITGVVSAQVRHLSGHTWEFRYTIRDTGTTPIAGFQINGQTANLFALAAKPAWPVFGAGICKGKYPGVLAYWSTGNGAGPIQPGKSGHFSFRVNTSGTRSLRYSLSFGPSAPYFGSIEGPKPSSLRASGPCR